MKANLKNTLFAGAASLLMLSGCNDTANRQVSRTAEDDAAYRTSQDYDRRTTDLDDRDLPGTYATPREDYREDRSTDLNRDDARLSDEVKITGDAQILGMLTAINQHEMHASGNVLTKDVSAPVKDYAEMLHKDHGANLEKTNQLIKDLDLTLSIPSVGQTMLNEGNRKVTEHARLTGLEFERAFMQSMIKGHEKALAVIDEQLMSVAKDQAVIDHLKSSRETIAKHLEQAKTINESLDKPNDNVNESDRE